MSTAYSSVLPVSLNDFTYTADFDFERYVDIIDLTNKRESFVTRLRAIHYTSMKTESVFDLVNYIEDLVNKVKETNTDDKDILQLIKLYNRILKPVAVKINGGLVKKVFCNNNLFFDNIYHNKYGDIKISNWDSVGLNDYAWDYACLISRSYDNRTYVAILNNNKLIRDAIAKYNDDHLQTRTINCMALVDFIDILKLFLSINGKGFENYSKLFSSEKHTIEVLKERLFSFVNQSYTTIDYFHYIYNK